MLEKGVKIIYKKRKGKGECGRKAVSQWTRKEGYMHYK